MARAMPTPACCWPNGRSAPDWESAATRANAAAAITVTRKGPATAPTRAEVDEFLA